MQFLWPYCFFTMVIVLNQFINLQEPSGMLPSKIKSRSFHHCTPVHWDGKTGGKKCPPHPCTPRPTYPITAMGHMRMLLKQLSKHALTSLTPHPTPPSRCLSEPSAGISYYLSPRDGDSERGTGRHRHNKSLSSFRSVCVPKEQLS